MKLFIDKFVLYEDCQCQCDFKDCPCKDDYYNLYDLDELYYLLKFNIESISKMNRLLIYNLKDEKIYRDDKRYSCNYIELSSLYSSVKDSMEKYKEMKREEMNKEENEDLIEYFRKVDRIKELDNMFESLKEFEIKEI